MKLEPKSEEDILQYFKSLTDQEFYDQREKICGVILESFITLSEANTLLKLDKFPIDLKENPNGNPIDFTITKIELLKMIKQLKKTKKESSYKLALMEKARPFFHINTIG